MPRTEYLNFRITDTNERQIRVICVQLGIAPDNRGAYAQAINFALGYTTHQESIMTNKLNPNDLYDMFVAPGTTRQEIANMDLPDITHQISEMRRDNPDDVQMTNQEIAIEIRNLAIGEADK